MKALLYFFLFSFTFSCTFAQVEDKHSFWAQSGIGISFAKFSESKTALNVALSLNYQHSNNVFSFNVYSNTETSLFIEPSEKINTYELMYGRTYDFTAQGLIFPLPFLLFLKDEFEYSAYLKAGVSYNQGTKRTYILNHGFLANQYATETIYGYGFPVECGLREEITNYFGLGLSVHANFNSVRTYAGANMYLYVGLF